MVRGRCRGTVPLHEWPPLNPPLISHAAQTRMTSLRLRQSGAYTSYNMDSRGPTGRSPLHPANSVQDQEMSVGYLPQPPGNPQTTTTQGTNQTNTQATAGAPDTQPTTTQGGSLHSPLPPMSLEELRRRLAEIEEADRASNAGEGISADPASDQGFDSGDDESMDCASEDKENRPSQLSNSESTYPFGATETPSAIVDRSRFATGRPYTTQSRQSREIRSPANSHGIIDSSARVRRVRFLPSPSPLSSGASGAGHGCPSGSSRPAPARGAFYRTRHPRPVAGVGTVPDGREDLRRALEDMRAGRMGESSVESGNDEEEQSAVPDHDMEDAVSVSK